LFSLRQFTKLIYVDWLHTGKWSAESPAIYSRGSRWSCANTVTPQMTQTLGDCKAPSRYRHSVVEKLRFAVYRRSRSALQAFWRSAGGKGQSPKTSGGPQYSGRGLPAYNKCAITEAEVQFCAGFPLSARSRHAGRDVKSRELWNKSSAARLYAAKVP
jgi:hypothetical protein